MKTNSHNSIGQVECLLDSISMMNIDVEIQHTRVDLKEFEDTKHDVVYITETTSLAFLGVMQTTTPIDSNISIAMYNCTSTVDWTSSRKLTEIVQAIKGRTVEGVAHLECLSQLYVIH